MPITSHLRVWRIILIFMVVSSTAIGVFASDENVTYLLITNQELESAFQTLVNWRALQGFTSRLLTITDICEHYPGVDEPEQIRNCIIDYYLNHGLLYVALGGDESVIPVRYCSPRSVNDKVPVDLYYSDTDGGDWDSNHNGSYGEVGDVGEIELTPDVHLGRIPLRTSDDADAYIAKVIIYETAPLEGFANSMLFLGEWGLFAGNSRPIGFLHHDPINGAEVNQMKMYYSSVQPFWQAQPLHFLWEMYSSWDTKKCGDYELSLDHICERLNEGYHFVFYWGHANYNVWGMAGRRFRPKHAAALTNPIPSIIMSFACSPAAFDVQGTCLSEAFLQNPHGGAVAYFGDTRSERGDVECRELFLAMFQRHASTTGEALTLALTAMAPNHINNLRRHYCFVLHGDPCIQFLPEESSKKLQLLQPKGCEVIQNGSDLYIRWNATGTGFGPHEFVKLQYSPDSGQTWYIVPGAQELSYNACLYIWKSCPLPPNSSYRIRVISLADSSVSDMSNQDFTIADLGLLTIQSYPMTGIDISGSFDVGTGRTLTTDFNLAIMKNEPVTLIAPTVPESMPELLFQRWTDEAGKTLSTIPSYTFTFTYDTIIRAEYMSSRHIMHYYVNDEIAENSVVAGDDQNDGLSPNTPKRHIKAVIEAYPSLGIGNRILVSPGIYEENLILGAENIGLEIVGAGQDCCIVDGRNRGPCITLNGFSEGMISGLTLQNGLADSGGGICCDRSSPVIRGCAFVDNVANNRGGGLYNHRGNPDVKYCWFNSNRALRGGGVGCRACDNVKLQHCTFNGNSATNGGGFYSDYSTATLRNCVFILNSAKSGSAEYGTHSTTSLVNCTISQNTATTQSGSIANISVGETTLVNCILWNDSPKEIHATGGTVKVTYSDVQGGWTGIGNIDVDPLFADVVNFDYHLNSQSGRWSADSHIGWIVDNLTSPCIDAGDTEMSVGEEPEPNGERINMGAYGGTIEASKSP